eukprot:CAMPEP_0172680650 /NCGR_PEP_ID=MMETSP1074-20121228/16913_1 /TAXON_ID=2916 /ORGANISM="Ceratium fusus, Strain PA161109" /LENGTH=197 /DNA_ID=CAMNT_0013499013 /DNA_START=256 /DNA_END=849 /DNA_ORIENTATION=-
MAVPAMVTPQAGVDVVPLVIKRHVPWHPSSKRCAWHCTVAPCALNIPRALLCGFHSKDGAGSLGCLIGAQTPWCAERRKFMALRTPSTQRPRRLKDFWVTHCRGRHSVGQWLLLRCRNRPRELWHCRGAVMRNGAIRWPVPRAPRIAGVARNASNLFLKRRMRVTCRVIPSLPLLPVESRVAEGNVVPHGWYMTSVT